MTKELAKHIFKELSELMQRKLYELQHPSNCTSARKAVCSYDLGHGCGFGCFTHHLLHCFMVAYWTNRTLVLDTKGWIYSKEMGWEGAFLPVSNTCISAEGATPWSADHSSHQIVLVTELQYMSPKPIYLPQSVPREFADRIFAFHEKPFVWFAGQFLSYLMRPNNEVKDFISNKKKSLGITKPYVGSQLTSKLSIKEYMWSPLKGRSKKNTSEENG
jgi:glycoprotein 6-alpha-L-fucosyltransferase